MCGRHWLDTFPAILEEYFDVMNSVDFEPRYNISPQSNVLTLFHGDESYELAEMQWGLVPDWAKPDQFKRPLINARSETIWEKPSFRHLIKSRRCIIPISGFFEWQRNGSTKVPHVIRVNDEPVMLLGGIYQINKHGEFQHCIVTTESNGAMQQVHHRQPVILDEEQAKTWIESEDRAEVDNLMKACPDSWLDIYPVSNYVSNARNQGAECIARI